MGPRAHTSGIGAELARHPRVDVEHLASPSVSSSHVKHSTLDVPRPRVPSVPLGDVLFGVGSGSNARSVGGCGPVPEGIVPCRPGRSHFARQRVPALRVQPGAAKRAIGTSMIAASAKSPHGEPEAATKYYADVLLLLLLLLLLLMRRQLLLITTTTTTTTTTTMTVYSKVYSVYQYFEERH